MRWPTSRSLGSTVLTMLAMPRVATGSLAAMPVKNESGMASTRPRPKSGVVRRPTLRTVASAGSTSSGGLQLWPFAPVNGPTVNSWRSDPPRFASGSNRPLTKRPKRRSMRVADAPPMAPASWQTAQPSALKIGPSPSSISSSAWKFALNSAKFLSLVLVPGKRSPRIADCSTKMSSSGMSAQPAAPIIAPAARTIIVLLVLVVMSFPLWLWARCARAGARAERCFH